MNDTQRAALKSIFYDQAQKRQEELEQFMPALKDLKKLFNALKDDLGLDVVFQIVESSSFDIKGQINIGAESYQSQLIEPYVASGGPGTYPKNADAKLNITQGSFDDRSGVHTFYHTKDGNISICKDPRPGLEKFGTSLAEFIVRIAAQQAATYESTHEYETSPQPTRRPHRQFSTK